MNNLYSWCSEHNYFEKTADRFTLSHLLYDGYKGGKLYIPKDKEYDFLKMYAKEVDKETPLYFVETRPKVFKFMMDIDMSDNHYWDNEEIYYLCDNVNKIIHEFFDESGPVICCTSPQKVKADGVHTGIHLIWPNLVTNSEIALTIRRGLIQKLKESDIKIDKLWEDVIDETIYTRNGYRMIFSDKMSKDKESGKKIIENRKLELLFVVQNSDINKIYTERLNNDTKALCLETSIRYIIDTPPMKINIPDWLEEDSIVIKEGRGGVSGTVVTSFEHSLIEKFMRKNLPTQFARGIVKNVCRYPDGNLLIKTNSRYCMNIERNHNSCGIFFFGSPYGMYQKCLCSCNTLEGRKHGYCKDYTSEIYKWEDELKYILFPDYDYSKKKKKGTKVRNLFKPFNPKTEKEEAILFCDKLLNDILKS